MRTHPEVYLKGSSPPVLQVCSESVCVKHGLQQCDCPGDSMKEKCHLCCQLPGNHKGPQVCRNYKGMCLHSSQRASSSRCAQRSRPCVTVFHLASNIIWRAWLVYQHIGASQRSRFLTQGDRELNDRLLIHIFKFIFSLCIHGRGAWHMCQHHLLRALPAVPEKSVATGRRGTVCRKPRLLWQISCVPSAGCRRSHSQTKKLHPPLGWLWRHRRVDEGEGLTKSFHRFKIRLRSFLKINCRLDCLRITVITHSNATDQEVTFSLKDN